MIDGAIILASFGSADDSIRANIFDRLGTEISQAFPTFEVRQAFTSNFMIGKIAHRGVSIRTPAEEVAKLRAEGFRRIILLPTHLTAGEEFDNKIKVCAAPDVEIIPPLMSEPLDEKILATILDCFKPTPVEDLILVGHGSPHRHNPIYERLQRLADKLVPSPQSLVPIIGVIEETDTPNFDDVVRRLRLSKARNVLLAPLLFNGGVHVDKDIAGSWFDKLGLLGYKVRVIRDGLGSFERFRALYIKKLEEMIRFEGCNLGGRLRHENK